MTGQVLGSTAASRSPSSWNIGVGQMTAEGTREPASEAGSGILGGVSSSPADSLRTQPQPRAVSDRRLVEDARHRLLDVISLGTLRPDDRLGAERELASRLSVSGLRCGRCWPCWPRAGSCAACPAGPAGPLSRSGPGPSEHRSSSWEHGTAWSTLFLPQPLAPAETPWPLA